MRSIAFLTLCLSLRAADIAGSVRDSQTGELLDRVAVQLLEPRLSILTEHGQFAFHNVSAGAVTITFSSVGYHLLTTHVNSGTDDATTLAVLLTPDNLRETDAIQARADLFQPIGIARPTQFSIEGNEIKNLASVLADDPLRSVHSMPGVTSNDDYESRFSLHGAPYERLGLYLDGVLLHQPFHTVNGEGPSGSMAAFNGDLVDSMTLQSEAYPARYADRTAGILDVRTRDGDRDRIDIAASLGVADAGIRAEGPLDRHKGSWLVSVRKSYLQYFLNRMSSQATMAFGFVDWQAELSEQVSRSNKLRLGIVDGTSSFDRSHWRNDLALNTGMLAGYRVTVANLEWQYAPSSSFLLDSHAAFMRERYVDTNPYAAALGDGYYGEWTGNTSATWAWSKAASLEFGFSARRIRDEGVANYYFDQTRYSVSEAHRGTALLAGTYLQQDWSAFEGRLRLSVGGRFDRQSATPAAAISPQASMSFAPWRSAQVQFGWGQYAHFPDVADLFSLYGGAWLRPERATHYVGQLEQRFGGATRLRVQVYQRIDRDLLFRPMEEARLTANGIAGDNYRAPIENSLRGYAKGVDVFLQRRSANRLTGWVSYALGYARMRDSVAGIGFPSDQDQRHTANAYLSYRIRPSVNLSAKWTYGSGFPIPGFFQKEGGNYYLSAQRNGARLGPFQRLDLRVNKSRAFDRWKMTIYGEVVNVFNAANYRFDSYNGYDGNTGQAYLSFLNMFPVLPSAGLMVEF